MFNSFRKPLHVLTMSLACAAISLNAIAHDATQVSSATIKEKYQPKTIIVKLHADKNAWTSQQREAMENQFAAGVLKDLGVRLVRIKTLDSGSVHYDVFRNAESKTGLPAGVAPNRLSYQELRQLIEALKHRPDVEYAENGGGGSIQFTPNDPGYAQYQKTYLGTSGTTGVWADGGANVEPAWDYSVGKPITVAIVDSGALPHPEFASRMLPGCQIFSTVTNCGNKGQDVMVDRSDIADKTKILHGTQIAGIILASANNGTGIAGINGAARLVPVSVTDYWGNFTIADAANGIRWAAGLPVTGLPTNPNPAKVINVSLGGDLGEGDGTQCSRTYQDAINAARAAGAIIVVAAGNQSDDAAKWQPSNCSGVVVVGATYQSARYAASNYGSKVTLSAPGAGIHSTTALTNSDGSFNYIYTYNRPTGAQNGGDGSDGTSFSAPQVTGALALMLSYRSDLTGDQAVQTLKSNTKPFPSYSSCATPNTCGTGMLNIGAAMKAWAAIPSQTPTCSLSVNSTGVPSGSSVTYTISGTNIPSGSTAYWYGTRNGSTDANKQYAGYTPGQYTYTNSLGSDGTYVRWAQIVNPQGSAICTTNSVTVQFQSPTCSLSASSSNVAQGASYSFYVSGSNSLTGTQGYWYGTKNGVTDASGQYAGNVPATFTYTNQPGWSGTYYRYMQIYSGSTLVCTTNGVYMTLQ